MLRTLGLRLPAAALMLSAADSTRKSLCLISLVNLATLEKGSSHSNRAAVAALEDSTTATSASPEVATLDKRAPSGAFFE